MQTPLSSDELKILRDKGVVTDQETVFRSGDLVVAENVITRTRRILDVQSILSESKKRILKG
mgnify:CR=1 FL=1|tara:strand:+ start:826 stop:1011 length:186 start_codon:yes stop_codon:yes gene_type:complete